VSENEGVQVGLNVQGEDLGTAPRAYANNVRVTFTPEDFTIYFGWYSIPPLDSPPESGRIDSRVEPIIQITLPLNLMRSMIAVMQRQLDGYESNFGEIRTHPARPAWMVAEEKETATDA